MATQLDVWDYVVFTLMLVLSSSIGIFYGFKGKQTTTTEYLMAGKNMHWLPIAISMVASFISAIAILGIPAEIYTYGIEYFLIVISFVFVIVIAAHIYAPIIFEQEVTSANEYLERRFNSSVRLVGCCLFMFQYILYLSLVLYAPSLALEAVAGVPMAASLISTGLVCTFYTTLGGMRAVIWTDVFQTVVMLTGLITAIAVGTNEVGGWNKVVELAKKGDRLTLFDFNPDPTVRNTFWSVTIGGLFTYVPLWTISQVVVQRFLSARSLKHVKIALYASIFGFTAFIFLCCASGIVMYAVYAFCDPRTDKVVKSNDQILAYFIVHKVGHLKGVAGIFMACLFSGALSTASSGLNAMSAIILEDIYKRINPEVEEKRATRISKGIACFGGILITGGGFLVSYAGTMVLQLAQTIFGCVAAPYFGVFTLGIFFRRANSKGAIVGTVAGLAMTLWLSIGAIMYPPNKYPAPIYINNCLSTCSIFDGDWSVTGLVNATCIENRPDIERYHYSGNTINGSYYHKGKYISGTGIVPYRYSGYDFSLAKLYSISYFWYGLIGLIVTVTVGIISSLILRSDDEEEPNSGLLFNFSGLFFPSNRNKMHIFSTSHVKRNKDNQDDFTRMDTFKMDT